MTPFDFFAWPYVLWSFLIMVIPITVVVAFFLLWLTKIFKISNLSYDKSFRISAVFIVSYYVLNMIIYPLLFGDAFFYFISYKYEFLATNVVVYVLIFFITLFFIRKFYFVSWKKSLMISVVFVTSLLIILFFSVGFLMRLTSAIFDFLFPSPPLDFSGILS